MVHAIQGQTRNEVLPQCSVLMQSDSMRPSNRAPHSYSHTCPHLKSTAHMCLYKETHVHTPTHTHTHTFLRLTSPLWVGAITRGPPDTFERSKGRRFRGFVTSHVYVQDGYGLKMSCVCATSFISSHGFVSPDELSVICCLFRGLCL